MQSIFSTSPSVEVNAGHLNQHFTFVNACWIRFYRHWGRTLCVGLAAGVKDEVKHLLCHLSPRWCRDILKTATEGTKPTGKTSGQSQLASAQRENINNSSRLMKSAPSLAVCSVNIGSLLQKLWCFDQHYHLNRCCLLRALLLAVPSDIKKKNK